MFSLYLLCLCLVNGVVKISDRVRVARCVISHIKLEKTRIFFMLNVQFSHLIYFVWLSNKNCTS